jgi:SOUL heme-binding protein
MKTIFSRKRVSLNRKIGLTIARETSSLKKTAIFLYIFLAAGVISMESTVMALEEPSYSVLENEGDFELRKYSSYIVAETYVVGVFEKVGSNGFRRLVDYIGGKNEKQTSISMTGPVSQRSESEKIKMTAPVTQERENQRWRITFMMPSVYSMETLPVPDDDRIALKQEKPKIVAAIRYSGTWGKKRYEEHEIKLMGWIDKKGWQIIGEPVWARYNPPFMPWFLRRNEILISVKIQ